MPNIRDSFPSKYLKASDLGGNEVIVTLSHVDFESVNGEKKAIIYFVGKQKGLILNKTNANKITEITGSALTEDWGGHQIRLYPTETQFQGEMVDCLRVKPVDRPKMKMTKTATPPTPPPDQLADDEADSIPFAWVLPLLLPAASVLALFHLTV